MDTFTHDGFGIRARSSLERRFCPNKLSAGIGDFLDKAWN
jgi:hypothetical protein